MKFFPEVSLPVFYCFPLQRLPESQFVAVPPQCISFQWTYLTLTPCRLVHSKLIILSLQFPVPLFSPNSTLSHQKKPKKTKTKPSPQTNSPQKTTNQNSKPQIHNSLHRQSKAKCFLTKIYKSLDCCKPGGIFMKKEIFRAVGVLNHHLWQFPGPVYLRGGK